MRHWPQNIEQIKNNPTILYVWMTSAIDFIYQQLNFTRDVFYVRREVGFMKTAKVNAYIMHIFGKIELLSIHATLNYFKIHYFNAF